jgi:subtilisin family serine protease
LDNNFGKENIMLRNMFTRLILVGITLLAVGCGTRVVNNQPVHSTELRLETLRQAINDIQNQSKSDYLKDVEQIKSNPVDKPEIVQPAEIKPPKGASNYQGIKEKDFITVKSRALRVARDNPKAVPEKGPKPQKPKDWRQLAYVTKLHTPKAGVDKRLLKAFEFIRDRKYSYAFIIINEYLSDEVEKELREYGVEILGPHASAYKVKVTLDQKAIQSAAKLPYVEWLGYSLPDQKLDIQIQQVVKKYSHELQVLPVIINFFDKSASKRYADLLRKKGIVLGQYDPDIEAYPAVVPISLLEWLAEQDYVLFIEMETPSSGGHDQSMAVMGVDYIRNGGGGTDFTGSSTILGIMDTGFMVGGAAATTHNDLNKYGCGKNFTSDAAGVWNDQHDHGTHVLGTIIGTGSGDLRYRGVATGVGNSASTRIRAAKIWDRNNSSPSSSWMRNGMDYMDDSSSCGSGRPKVVNVSGGARGTGMNGTDARSRKLDTKVWEYKQAYIVCGGNNGPNNQTIWAPGVAKNALAVGDVIDNGFQTIGDIDTGSSRGATGDGRMKPNVVGTGTTVTSADAGTSNGYKDDSGCSMATPHVSGIAATLLQHYSDFRDRPYLLRAHLMATAILHDDDTTPFNNSSGGRNTYGLGRVSSYIAHWANSNSNGWNTYWGTRTITNSSWGYRDITVPSGTDRLVVVMTWDESAASSGASDAVDYDLDLWIDRNADCTPNAKGECGEWASQSWDDNVEYLIINNPSAGTYRLKIINWDAPRSGVPAAVVATVIRGDPTPNMSLTVTANTTTPSVGSIVNITTMVYNPAYIASGVYLERTNLPAGLTFQGVNTTREDGVNMDFTTSNLSLGNIVQGDSRSATWSFRVDGTGSKTINFRTWSENGGSSTRSVTINP